MRPITRLGEVFVWGKIKLPPDPVPGPGVEPDWAGNSLRGKRGRGGVKLACVILRGYVDRMC